MIMNTYFLSFSYAGETGVIEFDTYDEASEAYDIYSMSGYAVSLIDADFTGDLAKEIRKAHDYQDRREAVEA